MDKTVNKIFLWTASYIVTYTEGKVKLYHYRPAEGLKVTGG